MNCSCLATLPVLKMQTLRSLEKVLHFHKTKQPGFCFDPAFLSRVCSTICSEYIWLPLSSVVIQQFTDLKNETGHEMYFTVSATSGHSHLSVSPCSSPSNELLFERHSLCCNAEFCMPSLGQFDSAYQSHETRNEVRGVEQRRVLSPKSLAISSDFH